MRGPVRCARSRCIIMTLVALWSIQHDSEEREKNSTNYFEFWSRLIINSLIESLMVTTIGAIPKNRQVCSFLYYPFIFIDTFFKSLVKIFFPILNMNSYWPNRLFVRYRNRELKSNWAVCPCYMSVHGVFLKSINRTFSSCTWKV